MAEKPARYREILPNSECPWDWSLRDYLGKDYLWLLLILVLFPGIYFCLQSGMATRMFGLSQPLFMLLCFSVLCSSVIVSLQQQQDYRGVWKARSVCVAFCAAVAGMTQVHMTDNKTQHGSPSPTHCSHFCDLNASMILLSTKWSWKILVLLLNSSYF